MGGLTWPTGKIVSNAMSPLLGATLRFTISIPLFFLLARKYNDSLMLPREFHRRIAFAGISYFTIFNFLFLLGLQFTSSSDGVLLFSLAPVFVAIFSAIIYKERLRSVQFGGLLLSVTGIYLIVAQSPNTDVENRLLGNGLIFIAGIFFAFYVMSSKPVLNVVHPTLVVAWACLYGWLLLVAISIFDEPTKLITLDTYGFNFSAWASLIFLGVVIVYIFAVLSTGIKNIGPTRSTVFINFVPFFGVLFSNLLLQEALSIIYFASFGLIFMGIKYVNSVNIVEISQIKAEIEPVTP